MDFYIPICFSIFYQDIGKDFVFFLVNSPSVSIIFIYTRLSLVLYCDALSSISIYSTFKLWLGRGRTGWRKRERGSRCLPTDSRLTETKLSIDNPKATPNKKATQNNHIIEIHYENQKNNQNWKNNLVLIQYSSSMNMKSDFNIQYDVL